MAKSVSPVGSTAARARRSLGRDTMIGLVMLLVGCGPAVKPTRPVIADPVGPPAQVKRVEITWNNDDPKVRWAMVGALVTVGVVKSIPLRYGGQKTLVGTSDEALTRLGGRVIGVDLTGLSSKAAVALLGRHARTVETVVWHQVRHLSPEVISALSRLSTRRLVLELWPHPDSDAAPSLKALSPLAGVLYGLVLGLDVTPGGLADLKSLKNLRVLHLAASVHPEDLPHLATLDGLRVLKLQGALVGYKIKGAALQPLGRLRELLWLDLSLNKLSDAALPHLAPMTGLCWLDLGHNRITGTGLTRLFHLKRLAYLELGANPLGNPSLVPIGRLASLQVLGLRGMPVDDDGMKRLVGLGRLRALSLRDTRVADQGLASLQGLARPEVLDLRGTGVTDRGVKAFRRVHPRCRLRLDGRDSDPEDLTSGKATRLAEDYYHLHSEWARQYRIQYVTRSRLKRISSERYELHMRYRYRCVKNRCAGALQQGFDQRVFYLQRSGRRWWVNAMGGHMSAKF